MLIFCHNILSRHGSFKAMKIEPLSILKKQSKLLHKIGMRHCIHSTFFSLITLLLEESTCLSAMCTHHMLIFSGKQKKVINVVYQMNWIPWVRDFTEEPRGRRKPCSKVLQSFYLFDVINQPKQATGY